MTPLNIPALDVLVTAGLIDIQRSKLFESRCRDVKIAVFRDPVSDIIYIDPTFAGHSGDYYQQKSIPSGQHPRNDMDMVDTIRRAKVLAPYISGKRWLDFGCGPGYQLRESSTLSSEHLGIELNEGNRLYLQQDGFQVSDKLEDADRFRPDVISLFHVLEHLTDPVDILTKLRKSSTDQAILIVEVPHARDSLLLSGNNDFRKFTLWSEHLVLHTRQSLSYLIELSGWRVHEIIGIQRYPVWNHLTWLHNGAPSGMKSSCLDSTGIQLHQAYEAYLAARDKTDTLLALATNG